MARATLGSKTLLTAAGLLVAAGTASGSARYTVTPLGGFQAGTNEGTITNAGQVGLYTFSGPATHSLYGPDAGTQRVPGLLGWAKGSFGDLNDRGQLAGTGYAVAETDPPEVLPARQRAVLVDAGGSRDLGVLPGHAASSAAGINERGMVVGSSRTAPPSGPSQSRAFAWTAESGMVDLGVAAPGDRESWATAVNERGQVVGDSRDASGNQRAFLYEDGRMAPLPTLGGRITRATDINDAGRVVGASDSGASSRDSHAFVLDPASGRMQDLGTLGGGRSAAEAINNRDQIVGWSSNPDNPWTTRGFLFEEGRMLDLNGLIGSEGDDFIEIERALDINDAGQILASGWVGGLADLLILTPTDSLLPEPTGLRRVEVAPGVRAYRYVPEPTALALFGVVAGLLAVRRLRG